MKSTLYLFLMLFFVLYSFSSFAQTPVTAEEPKPPLIEGEMGEPKPLPVESELTRTAIPMDNNSTRLTMDGLAILIGVYSPFHDEMKGIYGGALMLSGQYCLNMSKSIDILASVGYMQKSGDAYYDVPTFSSEESSKIRIIPMELSLRHRVVFMRNPAGIASRGLFSGFGINYIRAKEEITDMIEATGGDFGVQIFAGPQIFLAENLSLEGEVKLLLNEVDMKHQDDRYSITLSGLVIRAALSWYY